MSDDLVHGYLDTSPTRDIEPYINPHDHFAAYDRLGRKQPHRISIERFVLSTTGMADRTRSVPARAIEREGEDDEGTYALVACPCGSRPVVRPLIAKCAGCERYYWRGKHVYVVYGDMAVPARLDRGATALS